jgi:hypothetical protein
VLKEDVFLGKVMHCIDYALVGKFHGWYIFEVSMENWLKQYWRPLLGYCLAFHSLVKGLRKFLLRFS